MNTQTIADPAASPRGREPRFLGIDHITPHYLGPNDRQHYRTEAWDLADGTRVVIVSENGGTSLNNAQSKIAAAITERWGEGAGLVPTIIEDWGDLLDRFDFFPGARFITAAVEGGQALPVDLAAWAARGLVLPRTTTP